MNSFALYQFLYIFAHNPIFCRIIAFICQLVDSLLPYASPIRGLEWCTDVSGHLLALEHGIWLPL